MAVEELCDLGASKMAQYLRAFAAVMDELGSGPSIHIRQLISIYNSSSRRLDTCSRASNNIA